MSAQAQKVGVSVYLGLCPELDYFLSLIYIMSFKSTVCAKIFLSPADFFPIENCIKKDFFAFFAKKSNIITFH